MTIASFTATRQRIWYHMIEVPARKAMVMTGEHVRNDVGENVYGGDGDDASFAREDSDSDR